MRHWTPPPSTPPNDPIRKPWEVAVDAVGVLALVVLITLPPLWWLH